MVDDERTEARATERVLFFSDAVVAIAITLLALDLPVPVGHTAAELWSSVKHYDDHYFAFVLSFAVIAGAWLQHHRLMRYVERSDPALTALNLLWLFTIVLSPFATKLLISRGQDTVTAHALRFGFYALLQVVATGTLVVMADRIARRGLQSGRAPAPTSRQTIRNGIGVIASFALSIPLFFVFSQAWLLWIAGPIVAARLAVGSGPQRQQ